MPLGVWGFGVLSGGRCYPADGLQVSERLQWLYFEIKSISAKKARILKNVTLYNFFTFFLWADLRCFSTLGEFSSVISACFPSSVAVLLVLVGVD